MLHAYYIGVLKTEIILYCNGSEFLILMCDCFDK